MAFPVKLYIYEVSGGLARALSTQLLGRQIEGIWHTGVTAYGKEYFYGSHGISYVPIGSFMLGQPHEVVELGETQIPHDLFHEFLNELETSTFAGHCYHLFHHNCNTFSNEVAQFLTGNPIPEKIINLPKDVLSTPFGQMLLPMMNSMMSQFNHTIQANSENINSSSDATTQINTSISSTANSKECKTVASASTLDQGTKPAGNPTPKANEEVTKCSTNQKSKHEDLELD